jgi:hypothetical protein
MLGPSSPSLLPALSCPPPPCCCWLLGACRLAARAARGDGEALAPGGAPDASPLPTCSWEGGSTAPARPDEAAPVVVCCCCLLLVPPAACSPAPASPPLDPALLLFPPPPPPPPPVLLPPPGLLSLLLATSAAALRGRDRGLAESGAPPSAPRLPGASPVTPVTAVGLLLAMGVVLSPDTVAARCEGGWVPSPCAAEWVVSTAMECM